MELRENIELKNYTSFFIGGPAKYLLFAQTNDELIEGLQFADTQNCECLIFGGGSNMLVSDNGFNGLAIRLETVGIDIVSEDEQEIILKVQSGEVWDDVVRFACEQEWWGIENLSHIPGFTGAIPVQNVGAYGQEASQVISNVEVFDRKENSIKNLTNAECDFGYRSSIFNSQQKNRYVILSVDFKLSKIAQPNLTYGDLNKEFGTIPIDQIDIQDIRDYVTMIRDQKFPFPSSPEKGNSGSFFRGPILTQTQFQMLADKITTTFDTDQSQRLLHMQDKLKVSQGYKTPTAFLIELCGLKGLTKGGAQVNPNQPAIVLNSTGTASSDDVLSLYTEVKQQVLDKTGVSLEIEPELIGFTAEELQKYKIEA